MFRNCLFFFGLSLYKYEIYVNYFFFFEIAVQKNISIAFDYV